MFTGGTIWFLPHGHLLPKCAALPQAADHVDPTVRYDEEWFESHCRSTEKRGTWTGWTALPVSAFVPLGMWVLWAKHGA